MRPNELELTGGPLRGAQPRTRDVRVERRVRLQTETLHTAQVWKWQGNASYTERAHERRRATRTTATNMCQGELACNRLVRNFRQVRIGIQRTDLCRVGCNAK